MNLRLFTQRRNWSGRIIRNAPASAFLICPAKHGNSWHAGSKNIPLKPDAQLARARGNSVIPIPSSLCPSNQKLLTAETAEKFQRTRRNASSEAKAIRNCNLEEKKSTDFSALSLRALGLKSFFFKTSFSLLQNWSF